MKSSPSNLLRQGRKAGAAALACATILIPSLSLAASAAVGFAFSGQAPAAAALVAPREPATTATTSSPVFRTIQTSTELDFSRATQPATTAEGTTTPESGQGMPVQEPSRGAAAALPRIGVGVDATISDNLKVYTIPLSYSFSRNLALQVALPIVSADLVSAGGASVTNTGLGDVSVTLKNRIGSENGVVALYSLVTAKFPSGDQNLGLGTGSYDISLTEKLIKRFGKFRATLMGGVTQPLNKPTILGSKVSYGTTVSYLAALEHSLVLPELWFGVRAEGMHAFQSKVDGIGLGNALTTLDVTPELSFYFKRSASVYLGIVVPVYTDYGLAGGSNSRDVAVCFGVSVLF